MADPGDQKTYVYEIQADGSLSGRKQIAAQGSDGMTLDERGNLYLTGGGLQVYSLKGEKIAEIAVPERPANVDVWRQKTGGRCLSRPAPVSIRSKCKLPVNNLQSIC